MSRDYISGIVRRASETPPDDSSKRFVSREALIRDLDKQTVTSLLQTSFPEGSDDANALAMDFVAAAAYISPPKGACKCRRPRCTGARIIFVTLSLIAREDCIGAFFRSEICDYDLPYSVKRTPLAHHGGLPSDPQTHLAACEGAISTPPPESQQWSEKEKQLFCHFQWTMLSPYIENTKLADIKTENFNAEACLPWSEYGDTLQEECDDTLEDDDQCNLSPSFIRKVKISREHNNFGDRYLALKGQRSRVLGWDTFDEEVSGYRRTAVPHENIVTLLAAFKHSGSNHILLPWAEGGNLEDLWKKYSKPQEPGPAPQIPLWCTSDWVWNQCRGLADGLSFIHGFQAAPGVVPQLHADIQPRNILCFETKGHDGNPSYTLKITDFEFSVPFTKPGAIVKIPIGHEAPTYHPPENWKYEKVRKQRVHRVSQNWDVWCLGCVYLEFLSWFLYGHEKGVDRFADERMAEVHEKDALEMLNSKRKDQAFFRVMLESPPLIKYLFHSRRKSVGNTSDYNGTTERTE
ncbi:uncharacterized protein DNG_00086 [Cephalotrichum gorgonifer]|uniref:Protein kinase domain-containing protein n=1 Tax=Cephalotrichum gorgonifer TaxID=2041049 RepID=A0AAE8MQL1_9PEZI|nr:uncharacterized protein DNG_00086 [Cephalotrichum gorgonifer]